MHNKEFFDQPLFRTNPSSFDLPTPSKLAPSCYPSSRPLLEFFQQEIGEKRFVNAVNRGCWSPMGVPNIFISGTSHATRTVSYTFLLLFLLLSHRDKSVSWTKGSRKRSSMGEGNAAPDGKPTGRARSIIHRERERGFEPRNYIELVRVLFDCFNGRGF